jgi:vacuolar-type H+-ATPase subunit E/Vma4
MGWGKSCYTRLTTGSRFIDAAVESAYNVEKSRLDQLREDSEYDTTLQELRKNLILLKIKQ